MPKRKSNFEYAKLSREHKNLVKRLVSPRAKNEDWEAFYSVIGETVKKRHEESLWEEASISVDDFMRGELKAFLCENKCERLRQFLNLKSENSEHQHLFGKWFAKVVKSAKATAVIRSGREISGDELRLKNGNSSDKEGESGGTIFDTITTEQRMESKRSKECVKLSKLLRQMGSKGFSQLMARFWTKNPQKTYIAIMDAQLAYSNRKMAALLGKPDNLVKDKETAKKEENYISVKLLRLRQEFYSQLKLQDLEEMFPFLKKYPENKLRSVFATFIETQGEGFFGADGESDADLVGDLGSELSTLYFKGASGGWQLELKMPFEVSDRTLIRGVLSDGHDGILQGALFCCGKKRKLRGNGHFEFPVSEFKKFSNSSELYFTPTGGKRSDGVPFVPDEFDQLRPSLEMMESWAARKMSDSKPIELVADLLDDFGYVIPQLLLKDTALVSLPFERFGVPHIDRKRIRREYNEAFVLFRAQAPVDPDSPLSSDGFMLPLEWRFNPYAAEMPSNILPLHLSALGRRIAACLRQPERASLGLDDEPCKWQLQPSLRFFDDRVDFTSPGLLGRREVDVASATGALAVALKYAQNDVQYGGWPFVSLQYDFNENKPQGVGGIAQKLAVASSFGANELFVSPDQQAIPTENANMTVRCVSATTLEEIAEEVAFSHLNRMRPSRPVRFKTVPEDILAPRRKISEDLFKLANKKSGREGAGTFVALLGGPGMGKSILMWLLYERCMTTHKAFGYVCQAGLANQGWEFVKSLAHGLASTYGEVADEMLSVPLPDTPPSGDDLRYVYRNLVVAPLRKVIENRKGESLFILVDGLDEDDRGEVSNLLLDPDFRFPSRVGVVVSSRRIIQDEDRIEAVATDVMDLDGQNTGYARDVRMDVRTYIDQWLLSNESVNDWLMRESLASEEVKDAILDKDRSFLYASYVLAGIAEGRYGVRKNWDEPITLSYFSENLPSDLRSCFYDAFKGRFRNEDAYARVKPLLRLLVKKGRVCEAAASRRAVVGGETLGAILKALRGYAVVSDGEISLSSEALRMWLKDATHNAEFGV